MAKPLFKRILVPHDFSSEADQALRVAGQLAGGSGTVTALHVIEPYYGPTDMTFATMVPPPESLVPEQRRELEGRVRKILGAAARRATVRVRVGDPGREIVRAAGKADSVVMATMGRTGISHLLIGSVAERVVRMSPVPVLTLRARTRARRKRR
jgi:nucleotide-binding universal stress UspA family protein